MKLIITGGTGYLATEVIRQSLLTPKISSVVVLARKLVQVDGDGSSKLRSIVVRDYDEYPDNVKAEFTGADACIWTVAVTPSKSKAFTPAEAKPGLIMSSNTYGRAFAAGLLGFVNMFTRAIPNVRSEEVAAALLSQVVEGFEKEPLMMMIWSDWDRQH